METIDAKILTFIQEHHVLTLATCDNNIPYCSHCFYTYDEKNNWFIVASDTSTRHITQVLTNPNVSVGIALETTMVGQIQGVQIEAMMSSFSSEEVKKANLLYLKKFPFALLKSTTLWKIQPFMIKMTDNRLGFGKKLIWNS